MSEAICDSGLIVVHLCVMVCWGLFSAYSFKHAVHSLHWKDHRNRM